MTGPGEPLRVLVVCTANRARSPLAAELFRRLAAARGADVVVTSAGFLPADLPALDGTVASARRLGLDLTAHRSRTLTAADVRDADVVMAMEVRHVQGLLELAPECAAKVFRVRELAQLAADAPIAPAGRAEVVAWVDGLQRDLGTVLDPALDTPDPAGAPTRVFRKCAASLEADLTTIATAWFGPPTQ
jgi:protein-tyrosine phosphatase